jgi:hypothetical protein
MTNAQAFGGEKNSHMKKAEKEAARSEACPIRSSKGPPDPLPFSGFYLGAMSVLNEVLGTRRRARPRSSRVNFNSSL